MTNELSKVLTENRDRLRRIETRLTKFLETQGFETGRQKPIWRRGEIELPDPHTSIQDILNAIPDQWHRDSAITLKFKGRVICTLYPPDDF